MSSREQGSGTVLALALLPVLAAAALLALAQVQAVQVKHSVQGAADLAAIAAAQSLGDPCASASAVAHANGARLVSCTAQGLDYLVEVEVDAPSLVSRLFALADLPVSPVEATSRSGR